MRRVLAVTAAVLLGGAAAVLLGGARHRDAATAAGAVRGYRSARAPHHFAFLGVPYARPPPGRRGRFEAPQPVEPWSGLFEATHRVRCRQPDGSGSDDCLVVNVFAPERARALPVLVHVHGGGFQSGWGFHDAPASLVCNDIVVVSFNYRLGALGFLCLGTGSVPGNVGLRDQVAALRWVRRSIAGFGGDPADVTVHGAGAGAAAVELLLLAGAARNLFRRAILEDGSALSPSAVSRDPRAAAYDFAGAQGYRGDNVRRKLEMFYYKLPARKLTDASRMFVPCVEEKSSRSLLDRDPWEVVREGKFDRLPVMMVYGRAEEAAVLVDGAGRYKPPEHYEDLIPHNLEVDSADHRDMIANFIKDFYFEDVDLGGNSIKSYINYVNDVFLQYPVVNSAVHHAYKSNFSVFLMNFSPKTGATNHQSIIQYLSKDNSDEHELVSEILTTLWSNFIKLGDPTPLTTSEIPTIWQPVAPRALDSVSPLRATRCLKFSGNIINTELNSPQLLFWDRVYKLFYRSNQE